MDLMDRLSDLLPLLILIALSSSSKKRRKKRPVKKNQMQARREDEMVRNTNKPEKTKKPRIKRETAAFGLFGQLKEAFEEEMRKMEEETSGQAQSKQYKAKRYREEAEPLNFQGPKKHEDLAFYKLRPRYDDRKRVGPERIIAKDGEKSLDSEDILRGIIFAEILSPPKSRRK